MKRLSKTGIEYGDLSWNFYPGCLHKPQGVCPVSNCWAEGMWKRQMGAAKKKGIILPDFHHPHLIPERLLAPLSVKKPARILVNFMGDLFGDWVDPNMLVNFQVPSSIGDIRLGSTLKEWVLTVIRNTPHTYLFLTKNPAGLAEWSPFPDNCWVGTSATDAQMCLQALRGLEHVKATIKFLSLEPLLSRIGGAWLEDWLKSDVAQWLVIGQQTPIKTGTSPKIAWLREIIEAADKAGVPVFQKNNLKKLIGDNLRQEFPAALE